MSNETKKKKKNLHGTWVPWTQVPCKLFIYLFIIIILKFDRVPYLQLHSKSPIVAF